MIQGVLHSKMSIRLNSLTERKQQQNVSLCVHLSLLAAVVGCHHKVAVRSEVLDVWGLAAADGGHLALHPRDLKHAARIVF